MRTTVILLFFVYFCKVEVESLSFPGPRVYVVTPASRTLQKDEDKPAPFYYHKWMDGWRRMDTAVNDTTTSTSTTSVPKVKTPDLIFAEFESDGSMQKSIRKLLEKEKIKKASTMSPIYVPDEEENKVTRVVNYGLPVRVNKDSGAKDKSTEKSSYSFMFNNDHNKNEQVPIYIPSTTQPTTTTTTTTTTQKPINIENIWHIIDNEKLNQYSGNWQEVPVEEKEENERTTDNINNEDVGSEQSDQNDDVENQNDSSEEVTIDENFALPGFATSPGSGAENESRAIRTEPNIKFPYINLKPFQMKSSKNSLNNLSKRTKNNNLLSNLDQFTDLKRPVRGEAQDIVPSDTLIDRYNPAQPYLPQPIYGSKVSKQSSPSIPQKATANLVPPPPPPSPPKITGNDFPAPISYDSFPPYPPSGPNFDAPPAGQPIPSISTSLKAPDTDNVSDTSDSGDDDDGLPMDLGYRYKPPSDSDSDNNPMMNMGYQYKPPSPPVPQFVPTLPPAPKPFAGYSYNKPSMPADMPSMTVDKPDTAQMPPSYNSPLSYDSPPSYGHDDSPSYGHHDSPPYGHHSDYPDLVFQKQHDDMKGDTNDDMGMMPPAPPTDMKDVAYGPQSSDHGFPVDFPTDFKFHHDFDDHDHDHDHDHYHYHHPTTTTTETPRVNRFSYYYLGKKLYYLPLYFSVYFIVYVGALIIKAVLRHKIVYPNSWRPNDQTASFFAKRSVDDFTSSENLHEITGRVTHAIATAAEKYMNSKNKTV